MTISERLSQVALLGDHIVENPALIFGKTGIPGRSAVYHDQWQAASISKNFTRRIITCFRV
jgi:hypothetical protein